MIQLSISGVLDLPLLEGVGAVISIGDPGDGLPAELQDLDSVVSLRFHDAEGDDPQDVLPEVWHLKRVEHFLTRLPIGAEPFHLHVHCFAGMSRSTAVASFALAILEPTLTDAQIVERVLAARPQAVPNKLLLRQVDELLDRQLHRAWVEQAGRY